MGIENIEELKSLGDAASEEMIKAQKTYPNHSQEAALVNYRAGKEVWDTNGDMW